MIVGRVLFAGMVALSIGDAAETQKPAWYPFTSTCVNSNEVRDNVQHREFACPTGTSCLCTHFSAVDGSWNCFEGEEACRNIPHATPRYPTNSFQATIVVSIDDGSAVTNMTAAWIHDASNRR